MAIAVDAPTIFAAPGQPGSAVELKPRYENFIGGEWVAPTGGKYRENLTPATAEAFCEVADSTPADVELALDAAHAAKDAWGRRSPAERTAVLDAIADAMQENLEMLAIAESWENGKPVRETLAADIPLAIDHFRYFAGAVRAEEGTISEIDEHTYAYHFREPLGVVGQIIPFNFPLLRRQPRVPHGTRDPGRARVDELLPPLPCGRRVRRLQVLGVGRENHRMMLDHYTQTKCLLVSYDPEPLGFF
jgi:aldehyde dehydrogenase